MQGNVFRKFHVKGMSISSRGPFYKYGLTLIPAFLSNHMPSQAWDEITYLFH